MENNKSCWTCRFVRVGGLVFPCGCGWWAEKKGGEVKPVPVTTVDVGCKVYEPKPPPEPDPLLPLDL